MGSQGQVTVPVGAEVPGLFPSTEIPIYLQPVLTFMVAFIVFAFLCSSPNRPFIGKLEFPLFSAVLWPLRTLPD